MLATKFGTEVDYKRRKNVAILQCWNDFNCKFKLQDTLKSVKSEIKHLSREKYVY